MTPILFIHGEEDTEIPVSHSELLYDRGIRYNKNLELWIVPKADHGDAYFLYSNEYSRKVKLFFGKFLGLKETQS